MENTICSQWLRSCRSERICLYEMAGEEAPVDHSSDSIVKPIELSDIGYLQPESTFVNCPACQRIAWSVVHLEVVTFLQRLLNLTNLCKNWSGRRDCNHYCGHCGCFIGRYIPVGCCERCISRSARRKAAVDDMTLKQRPKDCAESTQRIRERILVQRAQNRAERATTSVQQTNISTQ